jgi:uncharacterized protein (DUF302 family)/intracellular sulfur oxidation DsrE/DsrF family protein
LEPAVRKRESQETQYVFDDPTPGRCFMFKSEWSLVLFVATLFVGVGVVYPEDKAGVRSDRNLHIFDIPAKLDKVANVAINIDRLALNGDMPIALRHLELFVNDYSELKTKGRIIAIFHTNAGHVTLNDRAYNSARHVTTGNPYKGILPGLMKKGVQVELCGATAKTNNWTTEDLLPGVMVNTDAMVRLAQLGLEGYVQIKECPDLIHNTTNQRKDVMRSGYSGLVFMGIVLAGVLSVLGVLEGTHRSSPAAASDKLTPVVEKHAGIIDKPSNHTVDETVNRLKDMLKAKGVTLFALVDHSGEAEKVGMKMRPTKLLIFGSPKAGTPLMLTDPHAALDLPLKILVWEDGEGKVWLSYNSPEYLKERYGLPQDLLQNIAVVDSVAAKAGE